MPRKASARKAQLPARERMVDIAAEFIHRDGYAATPVEAILHESGTGKSQLYHYFGSKAELAAEVLRYQARRTKGRVEGLTQPIGTLAGLTEWFGQFVNIMKARGCLRSCPIGALIAEMGEDETELRTEARRVVGEWREVMGRAFAEMQERGEISRNDPPEEIAEHVLAAIQGGLLLAKALQDVGPLERVLRQILRDLRRR